MTDGTLTTGKQAIALLNAHGFMTIDQYDSDGRGRIYELADVIGRRVRLGMEYGTGDLIKAIPMGEWVRDIERAFPNWPNQPYVTTVTQLECVLATPGVMR